MNTRIMTRHTAMVSLAALLAISGCSGKKTAGDADAASDADATDVTGDSDVLDVTEEPDVMDDTGDDVLDAVQDADAVQDVVEETGIPVCGTQPDLPVCEDVSPAPTDSDEIRPFVEDSAIPLRCMDGEEQVWDFDIFLDELDEETVFMMGEVHGSVEIGDASADLLDFLVQQGRVDVVAIEIAMDTTDAMNEYVTTGSGDLVSYYGLDSWPLHLMWRVLPERARALHESGTTLVMVGVDTPWRLAWVNEQIEAIAAGLSTEPASLLTDTLPAPMEYGSMIPDSYVGEAETYRDHVLANEATICAELTDGQCERTMFLARSLWLGAFGSSMLMYTSPPSVVDDWFARREQLIFYNYRTALATGEDHVYAHMGAAHTAKAPGNVAYMLENDHTPTAGLVYSTTPAYGPGSRILYGGWPMSLDPEPLIVSDVLATADVDSYFLATFHPGVGCVGNPFEDDPVASVSGTYGQAYDAMFWFRLLTPDTSASLAHKAADPMHALIVDRFERMQYADSRAWRR